MVFDFEVENTLVCYEEYTDDWVPSQEMEDFSEFMQLFNLKPDSQQILREFEMVLLKLLEHTRKCGDLEKDTLVLKMRLMFNQLNNI